MHTQEIACPNCAGRTWVNVPDPPGEFGWSALRGYTKSPTKCSHCKQDIFVIVGSSGEIRKITTDYF